MSASGLRLGTPRGRAHPRPSPPDRDATVQSTDNDAASSRLSAVRTGYLQDPFASLFSPPAPPKLPIINRGTYVRTTSIDRLVHAFLAPSSSSSSSSSSPPRKQIISLGAGTDTRFFRLHQYYNTPNQQPAPGPPAAPAKPSIDLVYHELDFPALTRRKLNTITSHPQLRRCLAGDDDIQLDTNTGTLHSSTYHLHPIDLRTLSPGVPLLPEMDPTLPTLVISECCLIYLSPEEADSVVNWLTTSFPAPATPLGLILYEPINGSDAFGRVMVSNLATRGIVLKTLEKYESRRKQRERLRTAGFVDGAEAADVDWLFENWVDEREKERIGKCEFLDEVEEWRLLARHYAVMWGWRGAGWEGWGTLRTQQGV